MFQEPTLTRYSTRAIFDALCCAVHRYDGRDSRGISFYENDARLWWLWVCRHHPSWLTDEQLALLTRWTMCFRAALVRKYKGNCERQGKAGEQSHLAHVHSWMQAVLITLYDEVYARVGRFIRKPSTPEAEALKIVYWDKDLGGAHEAEQQWLVARLPTGMSIPDFVGDRKVSTFLSQPTPEEWAESSWRENWLSSPSDRQADSLPYAAAPASAGQGVWL